MEPRKVKVIKADYHEECDLLVWHVQGVDDKRTVKLAWPAQDISIAFNILDKDGEPAAIPPDLIRKFCADVEGKEINLVLEKSVTFDKDRDLTKEEMKELSEKMDEMPMYETLTAIQKGLIK